MQRRSSRSYFRIAGMTVALATTSLGAQDAPLPRFGLGLSGYAGWITSNASNFIGAEGFVRVASGTFWSARIDGAYFGALAASAGAECFAVLSIPVYGRAQRRTARHRSRDARRRPTRCQFAAPHLRARRRRCGRDTLGFQFEQFAWNEQPRSRRRTNACHVPSRTGI